MKTFVTGATGFIGRYLVASLLSQGHEVVALTRRTFPPDGTPGLSWIEGDLSNEAALHAGALGADVLFHLAAAVSDADGNPYVAERLGLVGAQNVVRAAVSGQVGRLVHVSSSTVYAPLPRGGTLTEDSPLISDLSSSHPYSRQKLLAESVMWQGDTLDELEVVCIRPPMVLGAGDPHLPAQLAGLFTSTAGRILDDSASRMPWIDVHDLVRALIFASASPLAAHRVYNVANSGVSKRELRLAFAAAGFSPGYSSAKKRAVVEPAAAAFAMANWPFRRRGLNSPVRRVSERVLAFRFGPPLHDLYYDCSAARSDLGWEPIIPLLQTARSVIESNPCPPGA